MSSRPRVQRALRALPLLAALLALPLVASACGNDGGGDGKQKQPAGLVVYSGREEELVAPLYEKFEEETGIELEVRYAGSPQLAAQLKEEGDKSRADVFYAQDAGAIGSVKELLAQLPQETLSKVAEQYRADDGTWVGVTGRVRVLAWNTEELAETDLPRSVLDLTKPEWKGKVGVAPPNASFEAFVTAMRLKLGDKRTLAFLQGLDANDAQTYEKNSQIVQAVSSGEVPVGLVNHYYLYELLDKDPDAPVANHFFADGDIGNMVNVSAIGILEAGEHDEAARRFVAFMLDEGQRYIANEADEREYPLAGEAVTGNPRYEELPPLESIKGPDVDLSRLGEELPATIELIERSGLTS